MAGDPTPNKYHKSFNLFNIAITGKAQTSLKIGRVKAPRIAVCISGHGPGNDGFGGLFHQCPSQRCEEAAMAGGERPQTPRRPGRKLADARSDGAAAAEPDHQQRPAGPGAVSAAGGLRAALSGAGRAADRRYPTTRRPASSAPPLRRMTQGGHRLR
jgi:hypothetical protein